ncbi:HA1F protein, partial [Atractosteus spatula]|nr:HA1F protein [Atractosteus spatula]
MKPFLAFLGLLCLSGFARAAAPAAHSLWYVNTLIIGETQFPELVTVEMLDGVQLRCYDSDSKRPMLRWPWSSESPWLLNLNQAVSVAEDNHYCMKKKLEGAMQQYNHTGGVHTYQRLAGCELHADGTKHFQSRDAYDGRDILSFDVASNAWTALTPEGLYDRVLLETNKLMNKNLLQPLCINYLKALLQEGRKDLMKRIKPRVRVFQKTSALSGGTEVTCLASGFYPRALELSLLRDGRPVPEQELTGGEVLPNGDGTYQLRKSLALSEEERRERHSYTCRVQHSGLDNRMDIKWEPEPDLDTGLIAGVVIGVLAVALVLPVAACVLWRKKGRGAQMPAGSGVKYAAAQGSEQSDASSSGSGT